MSISSREKRVGFRWVRGAFAQIRAVPSGDVERTVPDVCTLCFSRQHDPDACDRPEWFEVSDGLVE